MDNEDKSASGVQGFLKFSVQVVGPGEKLPQHNEEEDRAADQQKEIEAVLKSHIINIGEVTIVGSELSARLPFDAPNLSALFAELEQCVNTDTILASNSSSFPISAISEGLKTAHRMIGLHFFMPAHLIPCVEVVYGSQTNHAIAQQLTEVMTSCAMVPVQVKKDLPGFLANRLQHALSREAFAMIDAGIATPEDIDKAVRFGFGFRYLAAGPVMQRDHAGIEIHAAAGASIYPSLNNAPTIAKSLDDRVKANHLGMKTGQGFFKWTPETIQIERKRYDNILKQGLQIIQDEIPKIK
jgi:3-hydroxybutyryl-CoA dehydrogenase